MEMLRIIVKSMTTVKFLFYLLTPVRAAWVLSDNDAQAELIRSFID